MSKINMMYSNLNSVLVKKPETHEVPDVTLVVLSPQTVAAVTVSIVEVV